MEKPDGFPPPRLFPIEGGEMDYNNILNKWLDKNGVNDKDAESAETKANPADRRRRLLRKESDASLDLHNLTQDEAWQALDTFFRAGKQQGFEKLLVIHGKGNHSGSEAVLKDLTRKYIENCPFAGESGHGPSAAGGSGTTWVLLKEET
jgi:DNA-nicking Smr family endonuclease